MKQLACSLTLLATALSLSVVSAFDSGVVQSGGVVQVVNGASALLAVAPGAGGANGTGIAHWSGPTLLLDFRKGAAASVTYGFQPGSMYEFKDLVLVTNNAGRAVIVTAVLVDGLGGVPNDLVHVAAGATVLAPGTGSVSLAAGSTLALSFKWQGNSAPGSDTTIRLAISAQ